MKIAKIDPNDSFNHAQMRCIILLINGEMCIVHSKTFVKYYVHCPINYDQC